MMFFKKKKLNEIDFTKKFADELMKRVDGLEIISLNELEIKTKHGDSSDFAHYLNNCYSEYLNDPKDLKQILEVYLNGAEALYFPDEPIQIERLLPIIKDQRFVDDCKLLSNDFEANHVYESYNSELYIFYAEDTEYTINYLKKENLKELNLSIEELRIKSKENLEKSISIERHGEDGYYMLTAGGCYESSLILLDIWNKENFQVNGNITIGIPSRDLLLITGSNDSKNLHKLFDTVKKINQSGNHIVSNKIFELKADLFEVI